MPQTFLTVQVEAHEDVLQHGHLLEQRGVLKGTDDTLSDLCDGV